jgi:hypothetical protein
MLKDRTPRPFVIRASSPVFTRIDMSKAKQELTDPEEWLLYLAREDGGYARLVEESGGMARAAYRLATARCVVESAGAPPTLEDLQAAARLLSARIGRGGALPITSVLMSDSDITALRATQQALEEALRSLPPPAQPSAPPPNPRRERSRPSAPHQ